jgi:hypothetical protein
MLCVTDCKLPFIIASEKRGYLKFAGTAELEEIMKGDDNIKMDFQKVGCGGYGLDRAGSG